jgi:peptidyl-prolyl cis-trans isomerase A (cyclophilin A)
MEARMKFARGLSLLLLFVATGVVAQGFGPASLAIARTNSALDTSVIVTTEFGEIEMVVDGRASNTAQNFLKYVDGRFYDGGTFYRTVTPQNQPNDKIRIEVIQGGVDPTRSKEGFPAIPLERTKDTGVLHVDGAVSMARGAPDTGKSSFFICIGDQPELDFGGARNADGQGFAAFGRVTRGMDIVRKIQQSKASAQDLTPPIKILKVARKSS